MDLRYKMAIYLTIQNKLYNIVRVCSSRICVFFHTGFIPNSSISNIWPGQYRVVVGILFATRRRWTKYRLSSKWCVYTAAKSFGFHPYRSYSSRHSVTSSRDRPGVGHHGLPNLHLTQSPTSRVYAILAPLTTAYVPQPPSPFRVFSLPLMPSTLICWISLLHNIVAIVPTRVHLLSSARYYNDVNIIR